MSRTPAPIPMSAQHQTERYLAEHPPPQYPKSPYTDEEWSAFIEADRSWFAGLRATWPWRDRLWSHWANFEVRASQRWREWWYPRRANLQERWFDFKYEHLWSTRRRAEHDARMEQMRMYYDAILTRDVQ